MKTKIKTLNKKLTLSKETIANLSSAEQKKALGGVAYTWYGTCVTTKVGPTCLTRVDTSCYVGCSQNIC
jgi:hypothetical protein